MPEKFQSNSLKNLGEVYFSPEGHFSGDAIETRSCTVNKGASPTSTGHNFG